MGEKLREGDFDGGVGDAVRDLQEYLKKGPPGWWERHSSTVILVVFLSCFVLFVWYAWWEGEKRKKDYDDCMRKLRGI